MTAKLISGAEIAAQIREEIKQEVLQLKTKHNLVPGLTRQRPRFPILYFRQRKNRQRTRILFGKN